MEGVLVSARRAASTMTVTVVSDAQGRYRFPSARLQPGAYALGFARWATTWRLGWR
jgi:hypothetical protein